VLWDRQDGRDCYDLIEWLAEQEWCDGKVGMSGTSYLAASQWFTAAEQPPHLAAINPWEGVSDVYRDLVMRGGMPDIAFGGQLQGGSFFGKSQKEDILSEVEHHPLVDELWENKIPDFDKISDAGVCRGQLLQHPAHRRHLPRLAADRVGGEMAARPQQSGVARLLRRRNREDLRRFFDRYLRDKDNGWEQTPRVRYSVLDLEGGDRINVPADQFPPSDVTPTRYYLDGRRSPDH
jgi:predicted acyl esterase